MKNKLTYIAMAVGMLMVGLVTGRMASAEDAAGAAAATPPAVTAPAAPAQFVLMTGNSLAVRAAAEMTITASTKRWGIEVYRDNVNNNLIYITEAGSISVVHAPK